MLKKQKKKVTTEIASTKEAKVEVTQEKKECGTEPKKVGVVLIKKKKLNLFNIIEKNR